MAHCTDHVVEQGTDNVLYVCDLTDVHKIVFPHHYDSKSDKEWWHDRKGLHTLTREPIPLTETRTASKATISSISAHTGQFGVVND